VEEVRGGSRRFEGLMVVHVRAETRTASDYYCWRILPAGCIAPTAILMLTDGECECEL
jgi:hypothetical protein